MADPDPPAARTDELVADLITRGIRRVHVLAWRDLDDIDAGGSEVHADHFMRRWADRGLDVLHRTSTAVGIPETATRNGYEVVRRGSRFSVFPRTVISELAGRMGEYDALVEIWNGVPWMSPLWCRRPRLLLLHHVHGPMWDQMFPAPFAQAGRLLEARIAPPLYRRGLTVTPSDATRDELLEIGFLPDRVLAYPNGVDEFFVPGHSKTPYPSVVAVGRLAPVKRFELVIDGALEARRSVPDLRVTIVGDGPLRDELQARIDAADATEWITLAGHVTREQLISHYQQAWIVASGSLAEGWGLSLTEGAACGTPCVATDIRGHRSSVVADSTGVLVEPAMLGRSIADVLTNHAHREVLGAAALARAKTLTWDASALGMTCALHRVVAERRVRG